MSAPGLGPTDIHVVVQPWRRFPPAAQDALRALHGDRFERGAALTEDPAPLLEAMDRGSIQRAGLVAFPCPDLLGLGPEINEHVARYAAAAPSRFIAFGGVHPRFAGDIKGHLDDLQGLGIRGIVVDPSHQLFPANAYTQGLLTLGTLYRQCEARGLPVLLRSGPGTLPGCRAKYGRPLDVDDVATDHPALRVVLSHRGWPLWEDEVTFVLRRHRNVWLDLAGVPAERLAGLAPLVAECAERVVWGSGWPEREGLEGIARVRTLPLDPDVIRRVTVENALQLFPLQ